MRADNWHGAKVAVLGYGVEGRSSAAYFLQHGAEVTVHDDRAEIATRPEDQRVHLRLGQTAFVGLDSYDVVVRSPGVRLDHPGLAPVDRARLTSQTELFLQRWRHRSIGVTGSKGKGTTVSLIAHILRQAGQSVIVAGNIGTPPLEYLKRMNNQTWAVLELSSFQLQDVTVSPHIAVMVMVVPEHLDYHGSVHAYAAAKARILSQQMVSDVAVLARDYPLVRQLEDGVAGHLLEYGRAAGDAIIETNAVSISESPPLVIALADTALLGRHNLENIAAAALATRVVGVDGGLVRRAVATFQPLPHRLQKVVRPGRIIFVNDSFATTPESVIAALDRFSQPVVLIVGGSSKQVPLETLAAAMCSQWRAGDLKGVVAIGQTGGELAECLRALAPKLPVRMGLTEMSRMVEAAVELIGPDYGVVLLSPGAASYGLFTDYQQRGDLFVQAVEQLKY